ncbi:hypothetical protein SK128_010299 [Halocaridina rubra]|uniref:Uncharacterized protein n=1 Tax=Halocaridina rubra TaxID=373956 RepID=A0AAN8X165_HALRR
MHRLAAHKKRYFLAKVFWHAYLLLGSTVSGMEDNTSNIDASFGLESRHRISLQSLSEWQTEEDLKNDDNVQESTINHKDIVSKEPGNAYSKGLYLEYKNMSESALWPNSVEKKNYTIQPLRKSSVEKKKFVSKDYQKDAKGEPAVFELLRHLLSTYLDTCSLTIFFEANTKLAAHSMMDQLRHRTVKMYDLNLEVLKRMDTWSRSLCDGYVFFIKIAREFIQHANFSHYHHSIHDSSPQSLWNSHAYHIIVLPKSSETDLSLTDILSLYNLHKTAKVLVLEPKDDYVLLWSHRVYSDGSGIRYVGTWKHGKMTTTANLFDSVLHNLHGAAIRIATFDHPPSVVYAYDKDHNIVRRLGVDMQILQTLAQARNFTPHFIEVSKNELWGFELPNGTWTGLVGKVFYEVADIGACNVFLELHRWKLVDYSTPYNFERGCFVAPSPKPLVSWTSPFLPFAWSTWISIAIYLAVGGLLLYIIANLSINQEPNTFISFSYDYLYTLGALTMKSFAKVPKFLPVRIYVGFTWIFGLIISTAYSANLIAFLSVTQYTAPIDTMKELSRSNLRIGGVAFWKTQFTASIDPVVRNFVEKLETDVQLSSLFDRVEAGDFALIENKQYLELQAGARYTYGSKTTIRIVRECLLPYSIGLAFQKNSPLKANFDILILRLFESGIVQKWKEEVINYFRQQNKDKRMKNVIKEHDTKRQPLSLTQLQGVFYLLGIGYLLAGFFLIAEVILFKHAS